jgi:hypothetical protein
MELSQVGRLLIFGGGALALLGTALLFADRLPLLGRLPGDIVHQRDGVTIFVPFTTMLVLSLLLTLVVNVAARFFDR